MPPATPLLAGRPTSKSHWPAKSYIPQVAMTLRTLATWRWSSARTPVAGLTPLLASVAPIIARSRQVTSMAHWWKYRSSTASGSSPITEKLRSRCAMARLRCPVSRSERYTSSSTRSSRPA